MHLRALRLRDFRSWPTLDLELGPGVTLIVGRNGFGKTNIVEAIGYAAHLGSHRVNSDTALVRTGAPDARVSATAVNEGRELTAHLLIRPHAANRAQLNRTRLPSARGLLGVVRTVLFAPEDLALVRGEPAQRRTYLDAIIATRYPRLAGVKSDFDKVLRQRNALLKSAGAALRRGYDSAEGAGALATLDAWDVQLARLGGHVIAARMELVDTLHDFVERAYRTIAPESRRASISYSSTVEGVTRPDPALIEAAMLTQLGAMREREIDRGTSLVGPHRDDLDLFLGEQPAKGFASHGESWSFAIALRFAEFFFLRQSGGEPILILDDVFAELDSRRRAQLVALADSAEQVLITAAVDEDLPGNLDERVVAKHVVTMIDSESGRISLLDAAPGHAAEADGRDGHHRGPMGKKP